ncbi:MAG: VCBS domain-containing protein [Pseudomonadota bacterium]
MGWKKKNKTYEFTAFTEDQFLSDGDTNLGVGDSFTMPAAADALITVTDNDSRLSGDSKHNENANDKKGQEASIEVCGEEVGNGGQIYAEKYFWVCDQYGNWYLMIEIEQEGGGDDYFAFVDDYGIPPAGAELYVACCGNVSCWQPKYKDLTGGDLNTGPEAIADTILIQENDTIGDAGADHQLNILDNDSDAEGAVSLVSVGGADPGTAVMVQASNGAMVEVTVDSEGNVSFDTGDAFDDLNEGETASIELSYVIEDENGKTAESTITINIAGENDGPQPATEYNILFLVDLADSLTPLPATGPHAIFPDGPLDLNNDGIFGSVLDAELYAVQQYSDAIAALLPGVDVQIGIQGFESPLSVINPNTPNVDLGGSPDISVDGGVTFAAGEDLTSAFDGVSGDGVAVFNTAMAGANDFFAFHDNGAADAKNLVFVLSDSFGFDWTLSGDPSLATELAELTGTHDAEVDTLIFTDPGASASPFLAQIEAEAGDGSTALVEDNADLLAQLGQPLNDFLFA